MKFAVASLSTSVFLAHAVAGSHSRVLLQTNGRLVIRAAQRAVALESGWASLLKKILKPNSNVSAAVKQAATELQDDFSAAAALHFVRQRTIRNTAHAELIREAAAATLNLEQPSEDEQPQATSHDELQTALRQTFIPHNGNGIVHRSGDMAAVGRHNTATATSAGVALVAGPVEHEFIEWCKQQGAQLDNVVFPMSFGGERGVGTAKAVAAGEVLFSVPQKMMMSAKRVQDEASETRFGALLHDLFNDVAWNEGAKKADQVEQPDSAIPSLVAADDSDAEDDDESSDDFEIPQDDNEDDVEDTGVAHGEVEETFLALFLAREKLKGASSSWAPWINVLPKSYPTVLVRWSLEEINALHDEVLAAEVRQSKARIEQTYAVLQRLIASNSGEGDFLFAEDGAFSLDLWYWAWLSVQTRSLCFPTGMSEEELKANFSENPNAADFRPQDLQLVMVPFVDMLNHQGGPSPLNFEFHPRPRNEEEQAKWDAEAEERAEVEREEERAYENATIGEWEFDMDAKLNPELLAKKKRLYADNREQWFSMRAEKPLVKGQQIMFSYGKRPNRDLLFSYGFVLRETVDSSGFPVPHAWDEIVPIQLPRSIIDRIVSVCGHELAIFKDGGLNAALTQASPVVLLPNCAGWLNGEDSSKLHLFRLYVASEEEAASNVSSRFIRPFSVDNEIAALRAAITVIEDAVNRVDTTTDNPQNGSDGIEVVRKQIADLYRQGQSVVLRRHYNRVKLVLDLQFHGRVTGQYSFPPSSAAQWVNCFQMLCKLAASKHGAGIKQRQRVHAEVTGVFHYLRSLPREQ